MKNKLKKRLPKNTKMVYACQKCLKSGHQVFRNFMYIQYIFSHYVVYRNLQPGIKYLICFQIQTWFTFVVRGTAPARTKRSFGSRPTISSSSSSPFKTWTSAKNGPRPCEADAETTLSRRNTAFYARCIFNCPILCLVTV